MINLIKLSITPIIIISALSFFFLWDVKYLYFQLRFFILILSFYFLIEILNFTKKDIKIILITSSFLFLILLQYYLNIKINNFDYANKDFFSIILLSYILYLSLQIHKEIIDQLDLIIILFYIIFFTSIIFSMINFKHDAPVFCGGISDIFSFLNHPNFFPTENSSLINRISFKEYIFIENSHLGMIAPAIILYSISRGISQKKNILFISTIIFFFICLIKSSTTFHIGMIICGSIFLVLNLNKFNNKIKIIYFIFIIISSMTLFNNKECTKRIIPIYNETLLIESDLLNDYLKKKQEKIIIEKKEMKIRGEFDPEEVVGGGSLSAGVYIQSFKIGYDSLINKPYGLGLNQYKRAYDHYYKRNIIKSANLHVLDDLNRNDASNNFIKIIVEFGVFGILFYLIIFLALISKKIDSNLKIFLISLIFTQSIRGAGYFNGGFALAVFLIIVLFLKTKPRIKNI